MPSLSSATCADCGSIGQDLLETRRRYLCRTCFSKYVSTKILKRMEFSSFKYQVGSPTRQLLLPLSGGVSSLALLHALDSHLKRKIEKQNWNVYDIVLVHVQDEVVDESVELWRDNIQRQFPEYRFLDLLQLHGVFRLDDTFENSMNELGIRREDTETDFVLMRRLFAAAKTATARSDLREIALTRLLAAVAKSEKCESILWGHSDSRLAAKVLADVAKGRGGSISGAIADGPSALGINFKYPVRELYRTELGLYLQSQATDYSACVMRDDGEFVTVPSGRNTSIDGLLSNYISSQGEKYPSIMANVVRTTGKLQVPVTDVNENCKLCLTAIPASTTMNKLCYGCDRMRQDVRI